jgi:hypothetical protein
MCLNIDFCTSAPVSPRSAALQTEMASLEIFLKESDDIRTKDCLLHIASVA